MGQNCFVINSVYDRGNVPPQSGQLTFDGSQSQLDVPILAYDWQIYSTVGDYYGDAVTSTGPTMTYNFASRDPFYFRGKTYTVCLRLVYDTETYGERCMERTADIEPFRSCLTLPIQ